MEWIRIENRSSWIIDIPTYHPDSSNYITFWKDQKRKCIEGFWNKDFDGYRYMPANLYFYINFCRILDLDEENKSRKSIRPLLRDLEWEMSYLILESRGFSGWLNDEDYTSDYRVKQLEIDSNKKVRWSSLREKNNCYKQDGTLKKYIPPRDNIRKLHSKPLGPPLFANDAKNVMIFGARGGGKSYFVGIGIVLHEIVFDGAKYYTEESILKPNEVHCNIGSWESNKSSELCEKVELCMNAFAVDQELGVWGDESSDDHTPMPFYKSMSGTLAPNNSKSPWAHTYLQKINDKWVKKGSKSKIVHTVYKDNSTAAAGGRYTLMVVEECGLHPELTLTHNSNIGCTQRDKSKFGTMIYIGTSGDIEKVRESRKMFMDPEAYDILSYDNVYEGGGGKIGFFIPAYYAATGFKDDNGNTNVQEAIEYYLDRRKKARDSKDPTNYEGELMNYPIKPSEMFLTKKGNILPIGELEQQRADLMADNYRFKYHIVGELLFDNKSERGVRFKPDLEKKLKPIYEYPTPKNQDTEGALIVYEPPIEDFENGKVFVPNIYVIGHDPVNADTQGEGLSLSSFHVVKMPIDTKKYGGNELVASYIGRPYMGRDEVNEMIEKVAMWYGNHARMINFERGGNIKEYFEKKNKLKPIYEYPTLKNQDTEGALIVYEPPIEDFINGKIFVPNIYVIGHDPVNSDTQGEGLSLSAFHVLKMPIDTKKYGGNELVASYIGRPYMGRDEVNEMIEKVAMWYGNHARMINFERGGNIKEYFEKKNKLNLLMTQPTTVMSYKSQGGTSRVLLYGTPVTSYDQKFEAIKYLRDWLLEVKGETLDGRIIRNLNSIRDQRLLEEMIAFDFEGNFDSVLAFAECIIALKEKHNQFKNDLIEQDQRNILEFLNNSISKKYKNTK